MKQMKLRLHGVGDKHKATTLILDTDEFSGEGTIRYQNRTVLPICVCTCVLVCVNLEVILYPLVQPSGRLNLAVPRVPKKAMALLIDL